MLKRIPRTIVHARNTTRFLVSQLKMMDNRIKSLTTCTRNMKKCLNETKRRSSTHPIIPSVICSNEEGNSPEKDLYNQKFAKMARSIMPRRIGCNYNKKIVYIDGATGRTSSHLKRVGILPRVLLPICGKKEHFKQLYKKNRYAVRMHSSKLLNLNISPVCMWLDYMGTYDGKKDRSSPAEEIPMLAEKFSKTCKFMFITLCIRDKRLTGKYDERAANITNAIKKSILDRGVKVKVTCSERYGAHKTKSMLHLELDLKHVD